MEVNTSRPAGTLFRMESIALNYYRLVQVDEAEIESAIQREEQRKQQEDADFERIMAASDEEAELLLPQIDMSAAWRYRFIRNMQSALSIRTSSTDAEDQPTTSPSA